LGEGYNKLLHKVVLTKMKTSYDYIISDSSWSHLVAQARSISKSWR